MMSRTCPTCKGILSKHAPEGYCPDCDSRKIIVASDEEIRKAAQFQPGSVVPAAHRLSEPVPVDSLGIDILLVTHEELAAIAAERPEINAALQLGPTRLVWRGIQIMPISADSIEEYAKAAVENGYRVARLQPGHGLKPDDPKWETLTKQEPEKKPAIWARFGSKWHFFSDPDGDADCGQYLAEIHESSLNRPPDADICPYCWAITSGSLVSSIDTTEVKP